MSPPFRRFLALASCALLLSAPWAWAHAVAVEPCTNWHLANRYAEMGVLTLSVADDQLLLTLETAVRTAGYTPASLHFPTTLRVQGSAGTTATLVALPSPRTDTVDVHCVAQREPSSAGEGFLDICQRLFRALTDGDAQP